MGRRSVCKECFHIQYGENYKLYNKSRMNNLKDCPNTLTEEEEHIIRSKYDNKCALTGSDKDVSLDHFIPLCWAKISNDFGIGGNTYANMLPLNIYLNKSKSNHNPFLWIKEASVKFNIDMSKWNSAIEYLAEKHQMTPLGFENRVNECYEQVIVKSRINKLNSKLKEQRKHPPYSLLRHLLNLGINLNVAVDYYGNQKAKQFVRNEEIVEYINKIKKTLMEEIDGNFNTSFNKKTN